MLEIKTVHDFGILPTEVQYSIQRAIQGKARLDAWLAKSEIRQRAHYEKIRQGLVQEKVCKHCEGTGRYTPVARESNDIHPSQLHKCNKLLWYFAMHQGGYADPDDIDPRLRRIFDIGTAWHDVMQSYGEAGAWRLPNEPKPSTYTKEVPIDPKDETLPLAVEFKIRGAADAELNNYYLPNVPGVGDVLIDIVHEYKTIKSSLFKDLRRPKPEHIDQATTYSAVLNKPLVVYFYMNKDNSEIVDFVVPFDHGVWDRVASKIELVLYWQKQGVPPPWELTAAATPQTRECYECPFRRHCDPPLNRGQ